MDKLIFKYEYGMIPLRIERQGGDKDYECPPEILGNIEIMDKLFEVNKVYYNLVIHNLYHYRCIGFKNLEDKYYFIRSTHNIFMEIQELLAVKYEVVDNFSAAFKKEQCSNGKSNRPNWK
ncbi:MAG: hypothetical protein ACRC6X_00130 [Culicoidibacterales bacterium]